MSSAEFRECLWESVYCVIAYTCFYFPILIIHTYLICMIRSNLLMTSDFK